MNCGLLDASLYLRQPSSNRISLTPCPRCGFYVELVKTDGLVEPNSEIWIDPQYIGERFLGRYCAMQSFSTNFLQFVDSIEL